jgi:autotransporter strand-loop-strand O-heptosyltransferase
MKQLTNGYFYTIRFYEGVWLQIVGNGNRTFKVKITSDGVDFYEEVPANSEIHLPILYYQNWKIKIWSDDQLLLDYVFNLENKTVLVAFVSNAIGDTLAWIPYVEEFRKRHNCRVHCVTFHNNLFKSSYPHINFIDAYHSIDKIAYFNDMFAKMGDTPYAVYQIGWFVYQQEMEIRQNRVGVNILNNPFNIPLQRAAVDGLGLGEFKEIRPKVEKSGLERPFKEKYITISEFASNFGGRNKMWTCPNGWQTVVDWLNDKGYKVVAISQERTSLKGVIDLTGNGHSLKDRVNQIQHSDGFIGVSSGLAWLAWGIETPVMMISNATSHLHEFQTGNTRILDRPKCKRCDEVYKPYSMFLDVCETHQKVDLSSRITPETVIKQLKKNLDIS